MAEVTYSYNRVRKDFNRPVDFSASEPEPITDIAPNPELKEQYVTVDPYETEIQNVPTLSEAQTNTERITLRHHGQAHVEGGWPLGIDPTEFEEKMKYCKKVERDEGYFNSCKTLVEKCMEKYLKQNNAIDIYGTYFDNEAADQSVGPTSIKTVTVFKDPSPVKRTASRLSWVADGKKLAVAYCSLRFQGKVDGMTTTSHVWDITNPNSPTETLTPASPLTSIEFYMKDPHLIAGGSYNGVVQYWDVRAPVRIVARSNIEESHKDPVWDLKWLQSKSGEILSVSTDGQAFIWDCRKPEKPVEVSQLKKFENETLELKLQPQKGEKGSSGGPAPGTVLGGVCIDYDPQVGGPAKYMIGTEQGTVLACNRKGKTAADKIQSAFYGHHGPVYAVQRNPFHSKYFLTVGDWTARLWSDENKTAPMYSTFYHKAHLTHGCWHPQRAGVFFTSRMDGCIDVWDLMHRQSTSVLSVQVSDYALHTLRPTHEGHHLATGAVDGSVTLLELSPSLYISPANEKAYILRMFENEAQRDKNLEKKKGAAAKKRGGDKAEDAGTAGIDDQTLQELADKYLKEVEAEEEQQKKSIEVVEAKRSKRREDIAEGYDVDDDQ